MPTPNNGYTVIARMLKTLFAEDTYPLVEDTDQLGGFGVAANLAAVTGTPQARIKTYMLRVDGSTGIIYQYVPNPMAPPSFIWQVFSAGGGGGGSVAGLLPSVALVAVANVALTGAQTIDGVVGTAGITTVLAVAQSTGNQNGPWVMQTGAWTRPTWYTSGSTTQAVQFMTTEIRSGTLYQGSVWNCTTVNPIVVDATATTWAQIPLALNANSVLNDTILNITITPPLNNATLALGDGTGIATAGAGIATFTIGSGVTITLPATPDTLVGRATTDVLTNKSLDDGTVLFQNTSDTTKKLAFALGGIPTSTTKTLNITGGSAVPRTARSSTTFTKTTDTTLASITGLSHTLTAGLTYEFDVVLFITADATGGSKYTMSGTATATATIYSIELLDNSTKANTVVSQPTALGTSAGQASTTAGRCRIFGTITCNAGGTLTPQFAQNASSNSSAVLAGSYFNIVEAA